MQHLILYLGNHPYLAGATFVVAILVIANELRERAHAFAAVSSAQAVQMMNRGALLLDVRDKTLFDAGHIGEARNVPLAELRSEPKSVERWREKTVITYCDSGMQGGAAARALNKLGFTKVSNLAGGLDAWRKDNLPVVKAGRGNGR